LGATHEPPHGGTVTPLESGAATVGAGAGGNGSAASSADAIVTSSGNGSSGAVQQQGDEDAQDEAPEPEESLPELRERIEALRGRLRWLGNVNPDAAAEYQEIEERYTFLSGEIADLEGAEQRMLQAEADLGDMIEGAFSEAFESVDRHFRRYFQTMFRGGTGRLTLTDAEEGEPGVGIFAQPPGKRVGNLQMLSGGERSLVAMALLFAMLEVNPAPFSVLDEVDAALDEANVVRFVDGLKELAQGSQFVVITHNRRTIEQADNIYGITMGGDSVSRVLSVRLSDLDLED
jgi:chromosome segregation protein